MRTRSYPLLLIITIDWDYLEAGSALDDDDPVTPVGSEITVDYSLQEFLQCKTVATRNYSTYMINLHLDRIRDGSSGESTWKNIGHSLPKAQSFFYIMHFWGKFCQNIELHPVPLAEIMISSAKQHHYYLTISSSWGCYILSVKQTDFTSQTHRKFLRNYLQQETKVFTSLD